MADKRIIEINGEASADNMTDNDYGVIDGLNGTRKTKLSALATWIINKWTAFINALTAVTSFSSGDNVVMVNGTTAKKMPKDTLLELTAQNALAGVIPAFSPDTSYLQKQFCTKDGKIYRFKVDHSGAWAAGDVDLIADLTKEIVKVNGGVSASAPYDNCDNFPANEIVSNFSTYANVSNLPSSEEFIVITLSNSSTGGSRIQYFFGKSNRMFVRNKYGSFAWSNWIEIGVSVICRGNVSASSAPYNNCNTFPNNEIVLLNGGTTLVNRPADGSLSVCTFSNTNTSSIKVQIATDSSSKTYMRSCYGSTWSKWAELANGVKVVGSVNNSSAPYNNCNNFPNNELVLCSSTSVTNFPEEGNTAVYTFSNTSSSSVKIQIANNGNGHTFIRSCYANSWTSWVKIHQSFEIKGSVVHLTGSAPYNDLDTFPVNEFCAVTSDIGNVAHKPSNLAFDVMTIGYESSGKIQIAVDANRKIFIRSWFYSEVWTDWIQVRTGDENYIGNPLMCYDNMVFIGDSLTYSAVFVDDVPQHQRQAKKTYPQMMAHLCGCSQETFATSGDSASQSWNRYNASLTSKTNALAVVYLGTNEGLTDTLATDAPESDPYTDWANTNTGCYAKYVARLQELGYKILLVKPWISSSGTLADTKKVVGEVAERFGCAVVQAPVNTDFKYHYYPDLSGRNDVHYNDLGYSWFAGALVNAVASMPELGSSNSLKYIIPD